MIFSIKPQIFELKCVFSYFRLKTHITLLLPVYVHSWEQRKLGDVVDVRSGKDYKHLSEGNIPVYGTGGFMLNVNQALSYDEDAIGIGRKGTIDKPYILKAPFWTVDTLFYAIPREKVDLNFAFDVFQNIDWKKKDESTGVPSLSKTAINEIDVLVPQYDEQQPLGQFFNRIDNLITLHQCKCQIDGCRFQSPLAITWEQRKLGEVLISLQNNTLSRADLSSEEGTAKNIHYGDILVKFGEVIDVKTESLPMIGDETVIAKYKSSFLQNGDVIVADTAEDETVGKCTEIAGLSDEIVISGLHTIPYRPLQKYAPGYLGYYMNSPSYHNQLLPLMQGIKVTSISKTALQNTDILYPKSATEQAAIGRYFRNLDNLITLHQCE